MGNAFTGQANFRMPAEGDYGWHDEWWDNSYIKDVVLGALNSQNRVISGGVVTDGGALTVDIAECRIYIAGAYFDVSAATAVALNAAPPENDEQKNWIYLDDTGALFVSTTAPTGDYVPLALVDVSDADVLRIADLRPHGYGDPEVLSAINKVLSGISGTVKRVFRYDPSKDSDRGAWREFCYHLPWFNEELNTATRGRTRKFPADSLIVALTDKAIIFDLTKSDCPMWMVFEALYGNMVRGTLLSISAYNGVFCAGTDNGFNMINFIANSGRAYTDSDLYGGDYLSDILGRNSGVGESNENSPGNPYRVVERTINDVAMTIIDDAPIDAETGIAVPTVGVATDGGASVIDGPAGVGTVVDSATTLVSLSAAFLDSNELAIVFQGTSLPLRVFSDYSTDLFSVYSGYGSASIPASLGTISKIDNKGHAASPLGLTRLYENPTDPENGMVDHTTDESFSGIMQGDIQLALSGENLTDKCVKGITVTDNGVATFTPVATDAELQYTTAVGGTITATVPTGGICYGWELISGGWLLRNDISEWVGVSESGGVLTIADGTSFTLLAYTSGIPSTDQLTQIESLESELFQEGTKCTLQGDSPDVKALDHDKDQDLLYAGTGDGATVFKGLLAIDHLQDGVDVVSLAGGKGAHFIASASEVNAYVPEKNLREELARLSEQTKAYGGPLEDFWFTGDASETDFTLPRGWKAKHVYDAGLIQRPGSGYTISFDGYACTISFAVAPGSGSDVCVLAQREV